MKRLVRKHGADRRLLDLTPMIDVALMLVVFLLLNQQRMDIRQLPVALPSSSDPGAPELLAERLEIIIEAAGGLVFDGAPITLADLDHRVTPGATVCIIADTDARHGRVVVVVDRVRRAGAATVYYASEFDEEW